MCMPGRTDAVTLAQYMITRCTNAGHPVSNLHLQKILYLLQEEWLGTHDEPLFPNTICAWKYGPVVVDVNRLYRGYGASGIIAQYDDAEMDDEARDFVDSRLDGLRSGEVWKLVDRTHEPGTPWDRIFRNGAGEYQEIPVKEIRRYARERGNTP